MRLLHDVKVWNTNVISTVINFEEREIDGAEKSLNVPYDYLKVLLKVYYISLRDCSTT